MIANVIAVVVFPSPGRALVMEAGTTPRPVLQDAIKRLRSARVHILGTVVNKLGTRDHSYGYHYHSYYSYEGQSSNKRLTTT